MEIEITCYTCHGKYYDFIDRFEGVYQEIIDCEICCCPNKITIELKNKVFTRFEITDGNE
tara:strand:+ start:639 stop:818 length:180 start_codon:yes stop_codon:yes gene_type:complete